MTKNNLPCISDVADLRGKKVMVRSSLDLPIDNGELLDPFRLERSLLTLNHLREQGSKVIVIGHTGRDPENSMQPVSKAFKRYIELDFLGAITGDSVKARIEMMHDGDVLMLENLRRDPREKENNATFAEELASLAEIYVIDDFPTAYREHASFVGVPKLLPTYAGINFIHEVESLSTARTPLSPSFFILGGAKFDTKMPLVEKFVDIYDEVLVGGALANDFFKAKGFEIGTSLVSDADVTSGGLINNPKILLPVDVIVEGDSGVRTCLPEEVKSDERIVDAGEKTQALVREKVSTAKTVLWNGPFGNYEGGFDEATLDCAKAIAESDAHSILGGGDTLAAIQKLNLVEKYNFVSTAGGAMLSFLEHGTLPAIEAILESNN